MIAPARAGEPRAMSLVLDSSVAFAWVYADKTTDAVLGLFDHIRLHGAWVPGLWRWEIANVLQLNVRRGRHGGDFRDGALASLATLPVKVDADADRQAGSAALCLAERHGLRFTTLLTWRCFAAEDSAGYAGPGTARGRDCREGGVARIVAFLCWSISPAGNEAPGFS